MDFSHVSVLLEETVGNLITDPNGIYVDGTLGGAGHSYEICSRLSEQGRLTEIDEKVRMRTQLQQRPRGWSLSKIK